MQLSDPVTALALVATLGVGGQIVARRSRLPSVVLLLAAGIAIGPVTGLVDPDALLGDLLFPAASTAVALVLFEGGLSLRLRELENERLVLARMLSTGIVVTWAATAGVTFLTGLPANVAILFGAIMTVTGPTVVTPLLREARPRPRLARILRWEAIVVDPVGAVLAVVTLEVLLAGSGSVGKALATIGTTMAIGVAIGCLTAALLVLAMRHDVLGPELEVPATLVGAVVAFAGGNLIAEEAGLVAVTGLGVALANQRVVDIRAVERVHESLSILLVGVVFVLLAARVDLATLQAELLPGVAVLLGVVLLARPSAVLLSTAGSGLTARERLYLSCMAPRGIVAAAISALFALRLDEVGIEGGARLAALTFLVMTGTVLVYGLAARPLARRLRVSAANATGVVVVGGDRWSLELAATLADADVPVLVLTADPGEQAAAVGVGLLVHPGGLDPESVGRSLDAIGARIAIAGSRRAELNELAVTMLGDRLGRNHVFTLSGAGEDDGRTSPFAPPLSVDDLERRLADGYRFVARRPPVSGSDDTPLLHICPDGVPDVIRGGGGSPTDGWVVALVPGHDASRPAGRRRSPR